MIPLNTRKTQQMGLLAILLTAILFAAKIFGAFSIPWLLVFAPVLILAGAWVVVVALALIVAVVTA